MLAHRAVVGLLLLLTSSCKGQCDLDATGKAEIAPGRLPDVEVTVDPAVEIERPVEVEVEGTVCDDVDFVVDRIVRLPPDPPFESNPVERVSLRIVNHGSAAVELDSGTDASFLDERRTVIAAKMLHDQWFMPRSVPAHASAVVEVVVAEGMGKALRTIEVEAAPQADPFAECTVADDVTRERITPKP